MVPIQAMRYEKRQAQGSQKWSRRFDGREAVGGVEHER